MSPAPLGTDRPQAPETESIYLNGIEEPENTGDAADKQSETDEDMPDSQTLAPTPEVRDNRITTNDRLNLLRTTMIPSSTNLPATYRVDTRQVARYSIPEAEIWEPYGTQHALRRLAEMRRLAASAAYIDAVSPASMEGDRAEEQELDEEEVWYEEEESPSYLGCDPTSLRVWHLSMRGYTQRSK